MADILIQPTVPSLFTHTESASSLIVDSTAGDLNNNTNIHHTRSSPTHSNNNLNNHSGNSQTVNKYIGHVSRLRSVFAQSTTPVNELKSGEHRSRYSNHHLEFSSPTRALTNSSEDRSLSPPLIPSTLLSATTSSSTIIERSRSLSNPRILESTTTTMPNIRTGLSSLRITEDQPVPVTNVIPDDHALRFRKAKEMFQTLEEEAARTIVSTSCLLPNKTSTNQRSQDQVEHENYHPDLMHDGSKSSFLKINTEHIPDLIIDHRQQEQQQQQKLSKDLHEHRSNRIREIPVEIIGPSSPASTSSDRSFISVPVQRSTSSSTQINNHQNDEQRYATITRNELHFDQHYDFPKESTNDFPADAIEQHRKHQLHDDVSKRPSNEEIANRIVASILPSNILKRMDHLNTKFIKPTTIDQPLPKLSFQETNNTQGSQTEVDNGTPYQTIESVQEEEKWIDNPILTDTNQFQPSSGSSSPIFYEKPGIPPLNDTERDELIRSPGGSRRVKFSNDPIRVYPTYSPSEYNRRNDDIDPFSASAEYELEKRIEKMDVFEVEIEKGPDGLGISVLGMGVGADSGLEKLGIFVKSLNPQGVIARDGRIQVGDQIIEVDNQSLVGVTHTFATSVLKATSGTVKFLIGREKDAENSEIIRLIQQSLQMDQERSEMSRALQHHHDNFHDQHVHDDGFPNLQLNDHEDLHESIGNTSKINHNGLSDLQEKNYDTWPSSEKTGLPQTDDQRQFIVLKERYQSMETTLANVEQEKQRYQELYEQNKKDLAHIEEKYLKAKKLIKELQDRESESREIQALHTKQHEQQQDRIRQLLKKNEDLEKILASYNEKKEHLLESSVQSTHAPRFSSTSTECVSRPPDIPERIPMRLRTSSGQPTLSNDRLPTRNTPGTSSVRLPASSIDKMSTPNYKSDFEVDRSPLLNHSVQMDKTQLAKARPRQLPSKRLSNPSIEDGQNQIEEPEIRVLNGKMSSTEHIGKISTENQQTTTMEYVEVKDWSLDQCIQWLTAQEMTSFIPIFLNRNIDGVKLLLLDSSKMKAMGIKSSKDRDLLKLKLKELKHAELDRTRERLLSENVKTFQHAAHSGNRLRSSSMTKLRERRLFGGSGGK